MLEQDQRERPSHRSKLVVMSQRFQAVGLQCSDIASLIRGDAPPANVLTVNGVQFIETQYPETPRTSVRYPWWRLPEDALFPRFGAYGHDVSHKLVVEVADAKSLFNQWPNLDAAVKKLIAQGNLKPTFYKLSLPGRYPGGLGAYAALTDSQNNLILAMGESHFPENARESTSWLAH